MLCGTRHPLRFFVASCLAIVVATVVERPAFADTIYLKNGRKIVTSHVVRKDGQVTYETPAGQLSLPDSIVDRVVEDAQTGDPKPGVSGDRAANLAIAPPNAMSVVTGDESARAAVRDGSIVLEFTRPP